MHVRRTTGSALATVVVVVALASGCGSQRADAVVTGVADGTTRSLADLSPADPADVVLTYRPPGSPVVALSIDQLESMTTVSATVHEPFLDRDVVFQGVPVDALLDVLDVGADVTSLHAVALNEYAVDLPVSIADHPGAILATRADGALIPVDQGGPTRIVFTDDHPDAADQSLWIWSLSSLTPS